jgi:molybdopterin converting factor small subunit
MPVKIVIPTALSQYTDGRTDINFNALTVGEALGNLTRYYAELRPHLFDEQNKLRSLVKVYLDNQKMRREAGLDTKVKTGDVIIILASVAAGTID